MTHDPAQHQREVFDRVAALFRDTSGQLFGTALAAFVGDRAAADDVVQEVFHALLTAADPLRVLSMPEPRLRGWLFTTLRHKIVDRFRSQKREVLVEPVQLLEIEQPRDVPMTSGSFSPMSCWTAPGQ